MKHPSRTKGIRLKKLFPRLIRSFRVAFLGAIKSYKLLLKHAFKRILWLFPVALLVLVGGIVWLISTEAGLIWLVDKVQIYAPGELRIAQAKGRLINDFSLTEFTYRYEELAIHFETFQFVWQPNALLETAVHIKRFHLNGLNLQLPASEKAPATDEPFYLPTVRLPVRLILEDVQVREVSVQIAENEPIIIDSVDLVTTTQERLQLQHFAVKSPQFQVTLAGELAFQPPYPLQLNLTWFAQLPNNLQAEGQGTFSGDIEHLVLTHKMNKPALLQTNITIDELLEDLRWSADLDWETLQWPLTGGENFSVKSQQAKARLTGTLDNYQITLQTDLYGTQIPPSHWEIKAQGDLQSLQIQSLQTQLLEGTVNASGQVTWYPELQAQLDLNAVGLTAKPYWTEWSDDLTLTTQLKARFADQKVNIEHWQIRIPEIGTETLLHGKVALTETEPTVNATLTWEKLQWPLSEQHPLAKSAQGTLELNGTPENYRAKLATQFTGAQLSGQLFTTVRGDLSNITIEDLQAELLEGTIQASGQVAWQDDLRAQFKLRTQHISPRTLWADWPVELSLNTQIQGEWLGQTLKISECQIKFPEITTQLALQGSATWDTESPAFSATLNWRELQWPLTDALPVVHSAQGELMVRGIPESYEFKLNNTELTGKDIPHGRWQATGQGDLQSVRLKQLQGNLLQGAINLAGQLNWQPILAWQITLDGKAINPGQQWTAWPGQLALAVQSQGNVQPDGVHTQITVQKIQGTLRNYPLNIQTDITLDGEQVAVKNLQVRSGDARISLDGKLLPQATAQWAINASDLSQLLPQLQGQLKAQGQLTGDLSTPHLVAEIQGKNLVFENNQLEELTAQIDANLATPEDFKIYLLANDFTQGTLQIEALELQTQGQLAQHTFETRIALPTKNTLKLQLAGNLNRESLQWQGQLTELTMTSADFGNWQSTHPSDLILSAQQIRLAQQCLAHQTTQLCMQAHWQAQAESSLTLALTELPVNIAENFLPLDLKIDGHLNGHVGATLQADGTLRSTVKLDLSKGSVRGTFSEILDTLHYQGGTLELAITERGLTSHLNLGLLEKSTIQGTLTLPNLTHFPLPASQPITGKIQARFADLQLVPLFVPQVANPKGLFSATVSVGGELTEPRLEGQVQIRDGALELPELGLDLQDLQMTVKNQGQDTIEAQGQIRSGKGTLHLNGQVKRHTAMDWVTDINLKGEQLEVANIPSAWVIASPNINVHILPKRVNVTGTVTIPQAQITPVGGGTTNAITVSEDVVVVNPQDPPVAFPIQEEWAVTSQIQVALGKQVAFEGMGLKARFQGAIVVSNRLHKETVGQGELQIVEGTYKEYGQNLKIDRGRVIFTGGPVTNPGLDIQAIRYIKQTRDDEILAGLRIQGTAQSPQISLFSQPIFDQTNTLSYILVGKPVAQVNEGEGRLLMNAVSALPLKRSDNIAKKIANQFGFDEAGISSEGSIEETALVLGKYLSPRLYVSYGIGLFENMSVFRIRYHLTKRLMLETETGTQSGADLHYTIEW